MSNVKLYNVDCFQFMKTLENNSIDFILTDPPYYFRGHQNRSVGSEGKSKFANSDLYKEGNKLSNMGSFDGEDVYKLLNECDRILKIFKGYFSVTNI